MKNHIDRFDLFWCPATSRVFPAVALLLFLAAPARAAVLRQLEGHVPPAIQRLHLQSTGALPDTNRLDLAIGVPLAHPTELSNFLEQIYDPKSANYRKYLTPDQFTERFGPSQADYDSLKKFAADNGLTITGTHSNRMLLEVNVSVADIQGFFTSTCSHTGTRRRTGLSSRRTWSHPCPRTFECRTSGD